MPSEPIAVCPDYVDLEATKPQPLQAFLNSTPHNNYHIHIMSETSSKNLAEFDSPFSNINRVVEVPDEVPDEGTKG